MFSNIGNKMKTLAQVLCWIGIIASILYAGALFAENNDRHSTIVASAVCLIVGPTASWISSWALYAFGQIVDDLHAIRTANDLSTMRPKYRKATELLKQKKFDEASALFEEVYSFQDAATMFQECFYAKAADLKKSGKFDEAIKAFKSAGVYKDAGDQIRDCWYRLGTNLLAAKDYDGACNAFEMADDYKDALAMLNEVRYVEAKELVKKGDKETAVALFACMMDYKDVRKVVKADPDMWRMYEASEIQAADENDGFC